MHSRSDTARKQVDFTAVGGDVELFLAASQMAVLYTERLIVINVHSGEQDVVE